MATARGELGADTVALASVPEPELRELFDREHRTWLERLHWDTRDAPDVALAAVTARVLDGAALRVGRRWAAFLWFQPARGMARLCGGLLPADSTPDQAGALLDAVLRRVPAGARVEGQVAAFEAQDALDAAARARGLSVEAREYLVADILRPRRSGAPGAVTLVPMTSALVDDCARVLVEAHAFGVEARINASFRTKRLAREYLTDILAGQGCGDLSPAATRVAVRAGKPAGFCLVTHISEGTGHVAQIAVDPHAQGEGVGDALLEAGAAALAAEGARRLTLSVSCGNRRAVDWYRRRGFRPVTRFSAYVLDAT